MDFTLLPKLRADIKLDEFKDWSSELNAFIDLRVKDEERHSKGLKLLKYAIAGSKLGIYCDERSTSSSILKRIEEKFMLVNTRVIPINFF